VTMAEIRTSDGQHLIVSQSDTKELMAAN
jgi:hypothetical protein